MTELEQQIIDMIEGNAHLSDDLKKRYILSLFLMETPEQLEYKKLIEAFTYRCKSIERGIYIVKADEKAEVLRTLDQVKSDILSKINQTN